jgi:hypothetical protein
MLEKSTLTVEEVGQLYEAGFADLADKIKRMQIVYMQTIRQNVQFEIKYKCLCDDLLETETELSISNAKRFARFNEEECWIFQDDGEDNLESLVCPVVMSVYKLQELLKAREEWQKIKSARHAKANGVGDIK